MNKKERENYISELEKEIDKLKGDFVYWKLEALAKQDEVNILVKAQQPFLDEIYTQQLRIKELETKTSGVNWKEEYDQAVNEIGQLQDQLKEAEDELRDLREY
jgi:predicted  nucleic acid-binding Zn-ribbon protein